MDIEKVAKLLRDRSRVVSIKINPELLKLLDEVLKEDKEYSSRNEFFERCILKYLEEKGKL